MGKAELCINTGLSVQHPSVGQDPHVAIQDLRDFLKVVRPDWSICSRRGCCNIDKVMKKLQSIGVNDVWDLMSRVESNTLNQELHDAGKVVFSKNTLHQFRHQKSFMSALEHLRAPFYRQSGIFAPVPQMQAKTSLWNASPQHSRSASSIAVPPTKQRPQSGPSGRATAPARPSTAGGQHTSANKADTHTLNSDHGEAVLWSSFSGDLGSMREQARPASCPRSTTWPSLKYVRTGKEHQCWVTVTKESVADAAEAAEELTLNPPGARERCNSAPEGSAHGRLSSTGVDSRQRCTTGDVFGQRKATWMPECAESDVDSDVLEEQGVNLKKAGSAMCRAPLLPCWANLTSDTLLAQGQAMLEEQKAMDVKKRMTNAMKWEGNKSVTRKVLTTNIKRRLQDEASRAAKGTLDCHQHGASIRKNLTAMANARRELHDVKLRAAKALGEDDKVDFAVNFGFMRSAKALGKEERH